MHTFDEEKTVLVHEVVCIVVAAGTAAATRLEAANVPAAESHFAVASGAPVEVFLAGVSDTVAVDVAADAAAAVVDNAADVAVE